MLTGHRRPDPDHIDDLVLVVSEAVSNSVEHGYGITSADAPFTGSGHAYIIVITGQVLVDPMRAPVESGSPSEPMHCSSLGWVRAGRG